MFAVNLKWKENDNRLVANFVPMTFGGKFFLDYLFSGGHGVDDSTLKSRVVESGGPSDFDVDSDVVAVFECDFVFPIDGDCMGVDEPEGLFGNYIDAKGAIRYLGDENSIVDNCNRDIEACVGYDYQNGFGARLLYCSSNDLVESIWRPDHVSCAQVVAVPLESWPFPKRTFLLAPRWTVKECDAIRGTPRCVVMETSHIAIHTDRDIGT